MEKSGNIESLKVEVGGHQGHYLKAGRGSPVVLLHGGASDSGDWVKTLPALSHAYSLYAPDLIGYGLSDRTRDGYYLTDFVEFTLGFTERVGLDSSVLVGHSLGGRVCLEIAFRYPERVKKLVLVNTLGFGRIARFGSLLGAAAWAFRKVFRRPQPYPAFLLERGEAPGWTCLEQLPGLKVPTLIVWKRHDPYFSLDLAMRAKELIEGARLEVLPGYGHAPHKQNIDFFNGILLRFLDGDRG